MKERNKTIDILKGIAILLVVFEHAFQRGIVYNYDKTIEWNIIESFDMQLFVLLSGFTLYLSKKEYNLAWIKSKFLRLIVPLISWTIIITLMSNFKFTGIKPFVQIPDSIPEFVEKTVLHPDWVFWFLWIVFVFMLIFYAIKKLTQKYIRLQKFQILFFISIEVIIIVIIRLLKKDVLGLVQIEYYFPMFVCGYYVSKYKDYIFKYLKYGALPSAILWLLFFNTWIYQSKPYRYILAICGIITIYYLVKLFQRFLKWLSYFGKRTLDLYICESICLNIGFGTGYIRVISIFITATILSLLIAKILKSNKYTNFIAFGSYESEPIFHTKV